jgi:serine/threonine protein kinase
MAPRPRDERQILATLDHPNIARLMDGGTTDEGVPYLVMEFVEGVPIDEYCATHGLGVEERLRLFRQACAAVDFAHRHLVVHRDLKPRNILVANGEPKVLDFGIARLVNRDGDEPLEPQSGSHTGPGMMTPEYASPEQLRGAGIGAPPTSWLRCAMPGRWLAGRSTATSRARSTTSNGSSPAPADRESSPDLGQAFVEADLWPSR